MFQHSETVDSVVNEDIAQINSAAMSQSVDGLILVTTSGVFQCKPKTSPEKLFLELAVNSANTSAADILAITSGLDVNKLYEVSAQAVIMDFNSNIIMQCIKLKSVNQNFKATMRDKSVETLP